MSGEVEGQFRVGEQWVLDSLAQLACTNPWDTYQEAWLQLHCKFGKANVTGQVLVTYQFIFIAFHA